MSEIILTDQNFKQEVEEEGNKPVLVDFWAEWCGPCKMQKPIIEQIAGEMEGKAKIGTLEVDQNPQIAQQFGVMSIPTMLLFKGGKPVWQAVGLQQKESLLNEIKRYL